MTNPRLPPAQQLAAPGKWPVVGERQPAAPSLDTPSQRWSLAISGCLERPCSWTWDELARMPQSRQLIDLHCVTRWSLLDVEFSGVPLKQLLDLARPTRQARYLSFVASSDRHHSTSLPLADALELDTLVALSCQGQPIPVEHGGPVRTIVPRRYFYKSLKWLVRIDVLEQDRLGYWESTAGYHNHADPWREERFISTSIRKQDAARILTERNIAGRDLLGLDASGRDLTGLVARGALLRNADFSRAELNGACFDGANLSNARFIAASLRHASLYQADLEGANFAGADLSGADLRGASLFGATFFALQSDTPSHPATFDRATRLDPGQLEGLLPLQAAFVIHQLSGR